MLAQELADGQVMVNPNFCFGLMLNRSNYVKSEILVLRLTLGIISTGRLKIPKIRPWRQLQARAILGVLAQAVDVTSWMVHMTNSIWDAPFKKQENMGISPKSATTRRWNGFLVYYSYYGY